VRIKEHAIIKGNKAKKYKESVFVEIKTMMLQLELSGKKLPGSLNFRAGSWYGPLVCSGIQVDRWD